MNHHNNHNLKLYLSLYFLGLVSYIFSFLTSGNLQIALYFITIILAGYHVIFAGLLDTVKNSIKHKRFKPNIHLLMTLGAIGAIIIKEYHEAVILILIFAGAHFLEDYAESKSKKEVKKLMALNVTEARLLNSDGTTTIISAKDLKIGMRILVLQGDEIPSDGIIVEGSSDIVEAAITGESIPVSKGVGDLVYGATINGDNHLVVEINKESNETIVAKIVKMVSETQKDLSKTAVLIKKIEPIYVTIVILLSPLFYLFSLYVLELSNSDAFYRTMVFLIATSPCALAVTDIPATLSTISNLAKNGILFKGGSYLANLANLQTIAFDKTGTLTTGTLKVSHKHFFQDDEQTLIDLIYALEKNSNHPLAKAILNDFIPTNDLDLNVKNITGVGLAATYQNKEYLLGKPSNHQNINEEINELITNYANCGMTVVLLSGDDKILALIAFEDLLNPKAIKATNYFNNQNINTVMITGDTKLAANNIAEKLNIKTVYANVLPEEKSLTVKELKNDGITAFVGDGINDAPALAASDIGIAMGDGTDIAIDVADAVLIKNDLNKIVYTHKVSKKLRSIVIQNILFAMFVILFLVVMNILGLMKMNIAVIVHEGSTLVVILSGLRMLFTLKNTR